MAGFAVRLGKNCLSDDSAAVPGITELAFDYFAHNAKITTTKVPYKDIVQAVNELGADVVAITGDLVDGSVAELREHVAPLAQLIAREGRFFVTGNHEYYSGAVAWMRELERLGLTVLHNQHVVIERAGEKLVIAGVPDYGAGRFDRDHRSDPQAGRRRITRIPTRRNRVTPSPYPLGMDRAGIR